MIKTIFVAGIYGVGKDYLCDKISMLLNINKYSASQLITNINKENYLKDKDVKDLTNNQAILINEVNEILKKQESIILTGHMCILNKDMNIEVLPHNVFKNLSITHMILLKNKPNIIKENLLRRDNKDYSIELIEDFQRKEEEIFTYVANEIGIKHLTIDLMYDNTDVERIIKFLEV